jgi:hypothetical protein
MGEVVRGVDVEGEAGITANLDAQPTRRVAGERQRLTEVGAERPGAVADADRRLDGEAQHVGAVAGAVGNERDRVRHGHIAEVAGEGQVAVGNHEMIEALAEDRRSARLDGAVETESRGPQHFGACGVGPGRHGLVVAGDEQGQGTRRGDHPSGEPLGQGDPLCVVEQPGEATLGELETLHRDKHCEVHGGQDTGRHSYARGPVGTTGVLGQRWRANVTPAGVVVPHDGSAPLGWYVAADDRWHDPETDTGVRHRRLSGTAVFETKVQIPGGDAVQRVWSVADAGGFTLVSVHNDSPAPIAVALTRGDLATNRPAVDQPIEGIAVPAGAVVLPVGHRATMTVGLAHTGRGPSPLPSGLSSDAAVVRGWITRTDVASRLELPEPTLVDAVRAARCEVLLAGVADVDNEPERHLLGLAELVRLGELGAGGAVGAVPGVAAAVTATARRRRPLATASVDAAAVVLAAAGERRALADLAGLRAALIDEAMNPQASVEASGDVESIPNVERRLVAASTLFPRGIPERWRGHDLEAHRLVAGPASRLSLAIRWHGANAAVLWEVDGDPVTLTATIGSARWSTNAPRGEALWQFTAFDAAAAPSSQGT